MSWNEPGRDRDPWNGGSGGGGPPDLDQMFRRLRERLAKLFRRPPGPGRPRNWRVWWFVPAVLIAIWLLTGFFQVPSGSRAVRVRLGAYIGTTGPGTHWHWPWPVAGVRVVDVTERRSVGQRSTVLTRDGRLAVVELTIRYRVADAYRYVFGSAHPAAVVNALASDALADAASSHTLDQLQGGGKDAIEQSLEKRIAGQAGAMGTGVDINAVEFSGISEPPEVTKARGELEAAQAKASEAATAARAQAAKDLAGARMRAHRMIVDAQNDASAAVAAAQSETAGFEALLPAFRRAPAATREMLRRSTLKAVLSGAPKIVVVGPVGSVQIPSWPAPASATAPRAATSPPAATATGKGRKGGR